MIVRIGFAGVSPGSLGDLLKGYGIMAIVGERWPEARFWWDDAFHLVVSLPLGDREDEENIKAELESVLRDDLLKCAKSAASAFKPTRGSKKKGRKRIPSRVTTSAGHDELEPEAACWARAIALPCVDRDETEEHPLFPGHGQEGSGDYFSQLEKAAEAAKKAPGDISWSLWARGSRALGAVLESGFLFFPESMKRYATGLVRWEHERDAARTPWDFLLAMRGAFLLRGSLRRLRWGRGSYPAFPFVFEGSTVDLGGGRFFRNFEIHLPTWTADHPRTLREFEIQIRQFQARLSARGFAGTAAEFRTAVVGRGVGAAFDRFHRFILEGRRPGQRQVMRQGIARGSTRVGGTAESSGLLRLMLAPVAEKGWFDQFGTDRLRAARTRAEEAIHRAVDEPGLDAYRKVLEALWDLNRSILLPGALRRELENKKRTPRPMPLLAARAWEEALREGLERDPAYRIGRAIGSILGIQLSQGSGKVGPILEHMLPVRYDWKRRSWIPPDLPPSRDLRWPGLDPLADFRHLLWWRWLDSAELDRLPFDAKRYASVTDVAALLRGEVDAREVHNLAGLFALLDWERTTTLDQALGPTNDTPVPPAYVALRLWFELGIKPPPDCRPPRDGEVVRLLSIGQPLQIERAVERALGRLRADGLPWQEDPRPTGKAVAWFQATISAEEARRMALAVLVPISPEDKERLSRRLWVPLE